MDRIEHAMTASDLVAGIRAGLALLAWCVVLGALALLAGCSSPIQAAARGGTIVTSLHLSAGEQVDQARDAALDAVEAAHPEAGAERNAALDTEAARWQPVGVALDSVREVLRTYAQSVTLAHAAGGDASLLPEIARLLGRVVSLYGAVVLAAAELGVELPELPAEVRGLAAALGGE